MEWLLIIGLVVWVGVVQLRLNTVQRQLRLLGAPEPWQAPPPRRAAPLVDAPHVEPAPRPRTSPPEPAGPRPMAEPIAPMPPMQMAPPVDHRLRMETLSNWMAENGLAWLGGGALALGGLFMVVYAAQRGFFTPPMRIGAAVVLGGLMLAVSEWIRRQTDVPGGRHQLAAAATAGAGAATIYGAIWAAEQLYHLIPFELAAILLGLLSVGLLAYSLIQGEALAILALAGAFAAPVVTGVQDWGSPAIDLYLGALIATGFAFSGLRRWWVAGYVTLAGAVFWSLPALIQGPPIKAALLLLAGALGATAAVAFHRRTHAAPEQPFRDPFLLQPTIALTVASVCSIGVWISPGPMWVAVGLTTALSALAVFNAARDWTPAWTILPPVGAATYGVIANLLGGWRPLVRPADMIAYAVAPAAVAAVGLVGGMRQSPARLMALAGGGVGAAVLATLIWPALRHAGLDNAWMPAAAIALMMAAGGAVVARTMDERASDPGLALWLAGAAELLFLTIFAAFDPAWAPAVQALAALGLAGLAFRLGWAGLDRCAVAGGLVALASMLRGDFLSPMLADKVPVIQLAVVALAAAVLVLSAGIVLRLPASRALRAKIEAEALDTTALMIALLGAFLIIHRLISGHQQQGLGDHLAASLRTVLLLATGLLLAIRARADDGALTRWRLRIVLIVALVHGIGWQMLIMGPWWGFGEPPLGAPLLNSLILSYLAPAAILFAIYRKGLAGSPQWTRAMAAAAFLFGLVWAVLTVRQAFHPHAIDTHDLGRSEACAYVALLLLAGLGLIEVQRRKAPDEVEGTAWLAAAAQPAAWLALAVSALILWLLAPPWWGPDGSPLAPTGAALLLFALYAGDAALTAYLGRTASRYEGGGWTWLARVALIVTFIDVFVLITLLVRYGFHGANMAQASTDARLETWVYSAVWALYGLGALVLSGVRRSVTLRWLGLAGLLLTLAKVFLFDMSRLDGVVRAASFLAVGGLLLAGALAARRLNAGSLLFAKPKPATP